MFSEMQVSEAKYKRLLFKWRCIDYILCYNHDLYHMERKREPQYNLYVSVIRHVLLLQLPETLPSNGKHACFLSPYLATFIFFL